jgi:hypothetical protein
MVLFFRNRVCVRDKTLLDGFRTAGSQEHDRRLYTNLMETNYNIVTMTNSSRTKYDLTNTVQLVVR